MFGKCLGYSNEADAGRSHPRHLQASYCRKHPRTSHIIDDRAQNLCINDDLPMLLSEDFTGLPRRARFRTINRLMRRCLCGWHGSCLTQLSNRAGVRFHGHILSEIFLHGFRRIHAVARFLLGTRVPVSSQPDEPRLRQHGEPAQGQFRDCRSRGLDRRKRPHLHRFNQPAGRAGCQQHVPHHLRQSRRKLQRELCGSGRQPFVRERVQL